MIFSFRSLTRREVCQVLLGASVAVLVPAAVLASDLPIGAIEPLPSNVQLGPNPEDEVVSPELRASMSNLGFDLPEIRKILQTIREGAIEGRWATILSSAQWPLDIFKNGRKMTFQSREKFISKLGPVAPMSLRIVIAKQSISGMLINAQGLMYGDGDLWVGGKCLNESCSSQRYGVSAINLK